MNKKFLKILALSAVIVGIEGSESKLRSDCHSKSQNECVITVGKEFCRWVPNTKQFGGPKCRNICSQIDVKELAKIKSQYKKINKKDNTIIINTGVLEKAKIKGKNLTTLEKEAIKSGKDLCWTFSEEDCLEIDGLCKENYNIPNEVVSNKTSNEAVCEKMNDGKTIQKDKEDACKNNKACKLVPLKSGGQACFTVCSQFTKQAKQKKSSLATNEEGEDVCGAINNACQAGTLWGFNKCRNKRSKEVKTGFSFSDNDS